MRIQHKKTLLCLLGAAAAVTSWAIADVVVLDPAEIKGDVSFSAETVTSFLVIANSTDGLRAEKTFTSSPYLLTVENKRNYRPSVRAYVSNPTASKSYLEVSRSSAVPVDNDVGPTTVDFLYPSTSRVNFSLDVTGGTISSYSIYAYAYADANTENYYAHTYHGFGSSQPSSASNWLPMVADDQVNVYGTVFLTAADGTQIQRSLSTQTVNLSQGPVSASWSIDLTNKGTLAGDVELTAGASINYHYVYFYGVYNTPGQGISGSKYVAANGSYAIDLVPGQYDVYLRTYFTSPSHYSETKSYRLTITAGSTSTLDFIETLGTGQVPLAVSGFFTNADLNSSSMYLRRQDPNMTMTTSAWHSTLVNGKYDFSLPSGDWIRDYVYLRLYNVSNPQLPLNNSFYRSHYTDSSVVPVTVPAGTTVNLGTEAVTLVKTNVYFDVKEASEADPEILLSSPYVYAYRYVYNGNGSLKMYNNIYAYGSSESRSMSALTMAAEPGTYTVQAFATVNGARTQFSAQNITFAEPAPTNSGTDVSVTPIATEDLVVNLNFGQVINAGITTVVETPLGPEAPEGLKAFCADGASAEGIDCSPMYYDIKTTADFTGSSATVCVRRKFLGGNGLTAFLRLWHYDEATATWEELPPPAGMEPATDCGADLAACGCEDEASCGIDYEADPPVSVIMVCGVTDSFSPFAVFQDKIKFTNEVDGVEYEGPTGPPSLQSWTAPANGTYRITAVGARGASALQAAQGISGGCGAEISGTFTLQSGDELKVLVGQKGTATTYSGGGGGGSFVVLNGSPLVIAGGGGGARAGALVNGRHGSVGQNGVVGSVSSSYTSGFIAGGTNGLGGSRASSYGSGGGGWSGNGASDGNYGEGGFSFSSSVTGGKGGAGKTCGGLAHGGYGGGGAGNGCYGGGGGGGYSGGGGGRVAGGGGSWNAGTDPAGEEGVCTPNGHGQVTIELVNP